MSDSTPHLSRRRFLAAAGATTAASATLAATPALAQGATPAAAQPVFPQQLPILITTSVQPILPKGKAKRVVICGGGWGGLSAAKHLRKADPSLEVILLEKNPSFFSGPMSNKWLVDIVDTQFLQHDYLQVADKYGYRFIQAEVTGFERDRKRVYTAQGYLEYDFLVLAAGIRYNFEAWFGDDVAAANYTRTHFPSAYIPNNEMFRLKKGIQEFKGGDLLMTLPPPPHRCPPSPYERATLLAWMFTVKKVKGHITILDPKDSPRPLGPGFKEAWEELYPGMVTYVPNARVQSVDPYNKRIVTEAGDFKWDHAILMTPHQAGDMVWKAGGIGKNAEGKPTGWANVDQFMLNLKDDPDTYVVGDSVGFVSPHFGFYPKSAHVAHRLGRIVAGYIAQRAAGKTPKYALPDNLCYMMVNGGLNGGPQEDLLVTFDYKVNEQGIIQQTQVDDNVRSHRLVKEDFGWATGMYADLFS